MAEVEHVRRLLRETSLRGRDIRTCGRGYDQALAIAPLSDEHGLADWRTARALWPQSGLWPIVVQAHICEHWRTPEYVSDVPQAIQDARTRPWPDGIPHAVVGAEDWPRWVAGEADSTRFVYGNAPDPHELLAEVPEPDRLALERCLFEWEEARFPTRYGTRDGAFDFIVDAYRPSLALILAPVPASWTLPMYIDIFMAGYEYPSEGRIGAQRLASAMKSWHTRYGAEPYLTSGLTLRFVVHRPPTDVRDAFELASELDFFNRAEGSIRELARRLIGSPYWEISDRP